MDESAIKCNEIIESYDVESKTISINFNEKKATCKTQKILYFTSIFNNYHSIFDSC